MATLTITNLTTEDLLLQELYTTLPAGGTLATTRYRDELHQTPRIQQLWADGKIAVTVSSETSEDDFIDEKLHLFQGQPGALLTTTRNFHEPTITPASDTNSPGQQPDLGEIGSTIVASYTLNTDDSHRTFKIPSYFTGNPSFHVHWTKEPGANGDTNQQGNAVRWRLEYTVFNGNSEDINITPTTLDLDDTYDDSGTTTRIVYRTANVAATGLIAGYYVGIKLQSITPAGSALTCEPALISVDLRYDGYINQ